MKRLLSFTLLLCMLLGSCLAERVTDEAGLLTKNEKAYLEEQIDKFQFDTGMDFAVFISNAEYSETIQQKADSFYDQNGIGTGPEKSGILYYIDMHNRIPYLSTCGRMIYYMTDTRLNAAHEVCYPFLSDGRYAIAVLQMMGVVKAFVFETAFSLQ